MHEVIAKEGTLAVPLLVCHGDSDRITDIQGSKRLHEKCGSKDKTLEVVHTPTHEMLLHAKHGPAMLALVSDWILARSSPSGKL